MNGKNEMKQFLLWLLDTQDRSNIALTALATVTAIMAVGAVSMSLDLMGAVMAAEAISLWTLSHSAALCVYGFIGWMGSAIAVRSIQRLISNLESEIELKRG